MLHRPPRPRAALLLALCVLLPLVAASSAGAAAGALAVEGATAAEPVPLRLVSPPDELGLAEPTSVDADEASETLAWGAGGIGPGSRLRVVFPDAAYLCTANFVWTDGAKHYLGTAGHCLLPENAVATHGPDADYDASKVRTFVCATSCILGGVSSNIYRGGMVELGSVAYARQGGVGLDFGLVEVPEKLVPLLRPGMPVWGGPSDATSADVAAGVPVCHYGYGIVYGETNARARAGVSLGTYKGGVRYVGGAAGGDSGSGLVTCGADADGVGGQRAAGIVTHAVGGVGGLLFATSIPRAQELAQQAGLQVQVVPEA